MRMYACNCIILFIQNILCKYFFIFNDFSLDFNVEIVLDLTLARANYMYSLLWYEDELKKQNCVDFATLETAKNNRYTHCFQMSQRFSRE